jgi:hypothetical protein
LASPLRPIFRRATTAAGGATVRTHKKARTLALSSDRRFVLDLTSDSLRTPMRRTGQS